MRKAGIFLAAVCLVGWLALPVLAQQEPGTVGRVAIWKARVGMGPQLEQGMKRHNDWHRKQNDKWELHTWQILTGPAAGQYYRGTFDHRWEDFDAEAKLAEADAADSMTNLDPYLESDTPAFYVRLPKLSRAPAGGGPAPFSSVFHYHLNIGSVDEFNYVAQKIHEAIGKTNWPVQYEWYTLANGGEHPTFVLVLPRSNWAGFAPPEKPFDKMLEEAYGRKEADSLIETLDKAIHCIRSEIVRYRPELSYVPAPVR